MNTSSTATISRRTPTRVHGAITHVDRPHADSETYPVVVVKPGHPLEGLIQKPRELGRFQKFARKSLEFVGKIGQEEQAERGTPSDARITTENRKRGLRRILGATATVGLVGFAAAVTLAVVKGGDERANILPAEQKHILQPDETVYGLALELCPDNIGTAKDFILTANGIPEDTISKLPVGTQLIVPDPETC